jgi:hypothetical protein
MPDWTIINQGAPGQLFIGQINTFASLGLSEPRRSLTNQGRDRFTIMADGRLHDDTTLFTFGNRVRIIHPDGRGWFQGVVTTLPRYTSGAGEHHSYEIVGPWYQCEQNVYKLVWPGVGASEYTSHLLLNYAGVGVLNTTQETIGRVLDYLLTIYPGNLAPFQYTLANILPGTAVMPPIDEVRDVLCSEVIQKSLRWHPRAVVWFDYQTSPPTLHITERSALTTVTLPGGNNLPTSKISAMDLSPRYDLQRPSVAITYEVKNTINGRDVVIFNRDIAPAGATGLEDGCRNLSLDLRGVTRTYVSAYIETQLIEETSLAWWQKKLPLLKNSTVFKNLSIKPGSALRTGSDENNVVEASLGLSYELTKGQIPPWLKARPTVQTQRDKIRAILLYDVYANDGVKPIKGGELLKNVALPTTSLTTGTYYSLESAESADPQPVDLALFLYNEVSVLQWDATFTFTDEEVGGTVVPGKIVNISGSRPEFATMNAIVQSVEEDLTTGTTKVTCGPHPRHEPGDILELIKVSRPRVRWSAPKTFDTGDATEGIALGEETADENSQLAAARNAYTTLRDEATGKEVLITSGKGTNGGSSAADAETGQSLGAAHVKVTDGTSKAQLNATDGVLYHTKGAGAAANILNAVLAHIAGHGPVQYMETKICVDVGGVIKQRTCIVLRGPAYIGAGDPA